MNLEDMKQNLLSSILRQPWILEGPGVASPLPGKALGLRFSLPPVKTMCGRGRCGVESFNMWERYPAQSISMGLTEDVFVVPIECQGCRSNVIILLMRRSGPKIQLVGRSEFEKVEVPSYVPKEQETLYSDAIIAFNSGQFLPAIFLLRSVIEQYMRTITKNATLRGEDLCDEYAKTLAEDFRQRFPSFKTIYGKLSDALHNVDANPELFQSQLGDVILHFEGIAVFAKTKRDIGTVAATRAQELRSDQGGQQK